MSIQEIVTGGGVLLIFLTLVQIAPIKINPWSGVGKMCKKGIKAFGRIINGEVLEKVSSVEAELASVKSDVAVVQQKVEKAAEASDAQAAISARARILRFGDEVLHGQRHTKDHFDSVLRDAKMYEVYCSGHPEFENGVTEPTIKRIKAVYSERLEKNDFL